MTGLTDSNPSKCPHGVALGPLDGYGVPEGERVFSTYCAECYRDQGDHYPWDDEGAAYEWPQGYHPRTLDDLA